MPGTPRSPTESFQRFCECLNRFDVDYVVVGSEAVAFHGAPRYSADFDTFVRATRANLFRVCAALEVFGLADRAAQIDPEVWARTGATLRLGEVPEQIDILLQLSGVSYETIASRALSHTYAGVAVRFIGLDDLIANKRAAGRAKDLADVEALERARGRRNPE
jgi:hypothetical protein